MSHAIATGGNFSAKILKHSVNPIGLEAITYELTYERFFHSEFMTHRAFCLAGDSIIEFDLPSGSKNGLSRRVHRMRLDEFVRKWTYGADRTGSKPKDDKDISWVDASAEYTSSEVASRLGMFGPSNINAMCRSGAIKATRGCQPGDGGWIIPGREIIAWRLSKPEHCRFDIKARLSGMKIRQLNEDTGDIQTSRVLNAFASGIKPVYQVVAGSYHVAGSADHRIMTSQGWKPIGAIRRGDMIVVRRYGKNPDERTDPLRLKKIDGVWRSRWQNSIRRKMVEDDPMCRRCRRWLGTEIHHIVPVHVDSSRATDETNVTLLCGPCHKEMHDTRGWQVGNHLYGAVAEVDSVGLRGEEMTYDLEIDGKHPNFIANGVVVHNSRNASSSRAIPYERMRDWITADPAMPLHMGANKPGMQSGGEIAEPGEARADILSMLKMTVQDCDDLYAEYDLHKEIINRYMEPWGWIKVVMTTGRPGLMNFFNLRISPYAHPNIQRLAVNMARLYRDSRPQKLEAGQWHTPYFDDYVPGLIDDPPTEPLVWSVARCAWVSYAAPDKDSTFEKAKKRHDDCIALKHASVLEHQLRARDDAGRNGGTVAGFDQYRHMIPGESASEFDFSILDRDYKDRDFVVAG